MLEQFANYLQSLGKSPNTVASYCRDVSLYLKWCEGSFGGQPSRLHRANVQEYLSYMHNIACYCPKTINRHLTSLRCLNDWLVKSGQQFEAAVLPSDFMKIQRQYASPSTVTKKDVEAFRQRLLESGSKRDYAIVTLYAYSGIRRSECVNLKLDQVDLTAKEIRVIGKGNKQRLVYINDKIVCAMREYLKERKSDKPLFFRQSSERKADPQPHQPDFQQIFGYHYSEDPAASVRHAVNKRRKTARRYHQSALASPSSRSTGPQHLANHRNVLRQKGHDPPARNHRRVQLLMDAFLKLKQTKFLRTDTTRYETTDALVMIRQKGKKLSAPTALAHMPEYSQKTSAVDTYVYGALAGAVRFELTARGFGER